MAKKPDPAVEPAAEPTPPGQAKKLLDPVDDLPEKDKGDKVKVKAARLKAWGREKTKKQRTDAKADRIKKWEQAHGKTWEGDQWLPS